MSASKNFTTDTIIKKWQKTADLLAELLAIPAALIIKTDSENMEVFIASNTKDNPYKRGHKEKWNNQYCIKVAIEQKAIHIANTKKSENISMDHNMIAYTGYPINYPDNSCFGTLCILDNKENHLSETQKKLLLHFKEIFEQDLQLNEEFCAEKLKQYSTNKKLLKEKENQIQQTQNNYNHILSEQEQVKKTVIESKKQLTIYNNLLDATQELTNTGGWAYDTEQKKVFLTNEVFRIYGLSVSFPNPDMRTNPLLGLQCFSENDRTILKNAFANCCEKGTAYDIDLKFTDYKNNKKWIRTGAKPILENNKIISIIGYLSDITKQKESEEKIQKLQKAVESLKGSIVITDKDGKIEYANPFFTEHTGFKKEEYMGKNPNILKTGIHKKSFYSDLWNTILSGNTWEGEICNKKKNGEIFWEKVIISPVFNAANKIVNFVAAKNDITENKKITNELIKAKERAEESDKLKSAFLKNISHEIRTPMNAILGFSELLLHETLSLEDRNDFTNILRNSTHKLLNIIESILTIAQIESLQIKLKHIIFTVSKLMSELFTDTQQIIIDQKKSKLELIIFSNSVSNLELNADYSRLYQMMTILLDNAVKFSDNGIIEFGCLITDHSIDFIVRDTGIGFPEKKIDQVLKIFTQASEKSRVIFGGLGLGLSICAGLIDLMKGQIRIQSKEGKGTEITLSLPKSLIADYESTYPKRLIDKKTTKNILIVEDEYSNYQYIKSLLYKSGLNLLYATNGEEAIEIFKNNTVDVILMDLKMTGMNGMQATKEIRKYNKEIPIIAQTAFSFSREECILAGFSDYIVKPFNRKQITKMILQYINE